MLFDKTKIAVLSLLLAGAVVVPQLVMAQADADKMQKDVSKEQKNIHTETTQKMKKNAEQNKVWHDEAAHRNKIVTAKDKLILKYHKKRLHHETKKGAKLVNKINNGH